jgi:adenylate cyclase
VQRFGGYRTDEAIAHALIGPSEPRNLVSRLEGLCRPLDREVLVSGAVAAETRTALIPLGTHALRGIASPCAVFTVPEN